MREVTTGLLPVDVPALEVTGETPEGFVLTTANAAGASATTDSDGTLFLADQAELDRDLQNGVLISARMVLNQQLQIAANEIARVGARYTRLDRVV